jgi:ubiquinone/menaquinone biosynthesis C-methylase UbiE
MTLDSSWLKKYETQLYGKTILEIGCGGGDDTKVLAKIADSIIAIDKDINGLKELSDTFANVVTQQIDISDGIFFSENQFTAVIASLSLHYFTQSQTENIINNIQYSLVRNGNLLVRVNSTKDINYGAVGYPEIESGLFNVDGQPKCFFTKDNVLDYFSKNWQVNHLEEKTIDRYQKPKVIWEFIARNI